MVEFIPDIERLTHIFNQATAPTFFLGAVAGFVSLMSGRLANVVSRIRAINKVREDHGLPVDLRSDIGRLRQRAHLLSSGIYASLVTGICATILLAVLFMSEFAGLKYAYGAGMLFTVATGSLCFGLVRFAQEARMSLSEADEYE